MKIIVDTREKRPLDFGDAPTVRAALKTGDYSIEGYEDEIACERKSLADLVGCVWTRRNSFESQLSRLAGCQYGLVAIETTADDLVAGCWHGQVSPDLVLDSVASWVARHGLCFWLGGRTTASFVRRWLFESVRLLEEGNRQMDIVKFRDSKKRFISRETYDEPVMLTIKGVVVEEIENPRTKKVEEEAVCYFEQTKKGLVLNTVNSVALAELYGAETDDWVGKSIILRPDVTNTPQGMSRCVRVASPTGFDAAKMQVDSDKGPF